MLFMLTFYFLCFQSLFLRSQQVINYFFDILWNEYIDIGLYLIKLCFKKKFTRVTKARDGTNDKVKDLSYWPIIGDDKGGNGKSDVAQILYAQKLQQLKKVYQITQHFIKVKSKKNKKKKYNNQDDDKKKKIKCEIDSNETLTVIVIVIDLYHIYLQIDMYFDFTFVILLLITIDYILHCITSLSLLSSYSIILYHYSNLSYIIYYFTKTLNIENVVAMHKNIIVKLFVKIYHYYLHVKSIK
ncbi:hypothetical protein RFI_03225 [Reticulomyxa filosa]|uniref:Uncharacterized protein n=1 Tax=Reticulomyxa filosa TaxID=46433 RepID=X6P5T7_RETFI|nr:hypothetical protein RFI_03225 [Reticulomyxa filosa]|eukprot:ETO33870.1 hypothetical protein RFI_03225 [Reticulomyxa filosa]